MRRMLSLLILLLLVPCAAARAETYANPSLDFRVEIPARFQTLPLPPKTVVAFATSDPSLGVPEATVSITRLGGTIGREHLRAQDAPIPGATVTTAPWKSFDVDVIGAHMTVNGHTLAVRAAQIPLKREAIQVNVVVPLEREASADSVLKEFLATLDGPSNWLNDEERSERFGMATGTLLSMIITGIIVLVARRKRASR